MNRPTIRRVIAASILTFLALAGAGAEEAPGEVARGILREIGAAVEPCPPQEIDASPDRGLLCAAYPKRFSYFKLDWESTLARYDLRSRVEPASPWALREGRYVRDYEAGDAKLSVSFDERSGRLVLAFTLPDDDPSAQPPGPSAVGSSRPSSRDSAPTAGFGGGSAPLPIPESRVEPELPERAGLLGIEGEVTLQVLVRTDGTVGEVQVLRVEPEGYDFDTAAVEAIRQWRFEPARKDGEPVDAWFTVFHEFKPR